jgi:hypothetical protein
LPNAKSTQGFGFASYEKSFLLMIRNKQLEHKYEIKNSPAIFSKKNSPPIFAKLAVHDNQSTCVHTHISIDPGIYQLPNPNQSIHTYKLFRVSKLAQWV